MQKTFIRDQFHVRNLSEMQKALIGCKGVSQIDDILVYGANEQEHNDRQRVVLEQPPKVGITLNKDQCKHNVREIAFLGHIVSSCGIQTYPRKTYIVHEHR